MTPVPIPAQPESPTMNSRTLLVFLSTLLFATWALQCVPIFMIGDLESPAARPWLVAVMFMPALWTLGWLRLDRQRWSRIAWRPGRPGVLLASLLIPGALALAAIALVAGLGWGESTMLRLGPGTPEFLRGPWQLGPGEQAWPMFLFNFFLTTAVFALITGAVTIGEEFGWRGLLQREFIERFGRLRGVVLLGAFWAVWHLPSLLAGYNYPEYPVLGALVLFPLTLISWSIVLAWLTLRARSFWPAVFVHGAINSLFAGVTGPSLALSVPRLQVDLLILTLEIALALLCVLHWRRTA